MRFLTIGDKPLNLRNTTPPSLSQMLSTAANSLVLLDEYKNTLDMRIVEIIKGAYDGVGRACMDMDRGKQIERTPVDCGVIVCGQEMPTLDIAMFTRIIYLPTSATVHDREAKDRFNHLSDIRKLGLQRLKTDKGQREFKEKHPVLMLRLANFVSQYKQLARREGEKKIIMDRDSIRYYLTTGSAYLGVKPSERYVSMKDGVPETVIEPEKDTHGIAKLDSQRRPIIHSVTIYKFDRFLCFDYELLKSRYGLRLERFSQLEADRIEQEEEEASRPRISEPEIF